MAGDFDNIAVMNQTIDYSVGNDSVSEDIRPFRKRLIGCKDSRPELVSCSDELKESESGVLVNREIADLCQELGGKLGYTVHVLRISARGTEDNIYDEYYRGIEPSVSSDNKNKPSFSNDDSLRKMLCLASQKIVERWTQRCRNWDIVLS